MSSGALLINRTIDLRDSEAATFAATLDGLSAGIFLVDADCRLVHANAAGHDMLSADGVLSSTGGQLVARDMKSNRTLREVLADRRNALDAKGTALTLTARDGERYVMHGLPLTSAARTSIGMTYRAVAALFVRKVALDSPCGELVARAFELTPAETACAAGYRRRWGRSGDGVGFGCRRNHHQDSFAPRILQDRLQPPGRSRQARRRIFQSVGELTQPPRVGQGG